MSLGDEKSHVLRFSEQHGRVVSVLSASSGSERSGLDFARNTGPWSLCRSGFSAMMPTPIFTDLRGWGWKGFSCLVLSAGLGASDVEGSTLIQARIDKQQEFFVPPRVS